jgi:hypothetical protein
MQDIDDTTENIQNSVNDCLNVDFNSTIGAAEKRKSIEYTTNWTHDADLDMGTGYTPTKIFDFVGSDSNNSTVQIVCGVTTGNTWKIWYRVGAGDWVPFGNTDNGYIFELSVDDEPQFQSLDGACRIAMGEAITPKILFCKDDVWYAEDAVPELKITFAEGTSENFEIVWDYEQILTFTVPTPTIWPINFIVPGTANAYDSGTKTLTVNTILTDAGSRSEGATRGGTNTSLKNSFLNALTLITDIWGATPTENTGKDFYSAYTIDIIESAYAEKVPSSERPIGSTRGTTSELVGLKIVGHCTKTSVEKKFTSATITAHPTWWWGYGRWQTITDSLGVADSACVDTPIGDYAFKVTGVFDNNETISLGECKITNVQNNNIFVLRVKYRKTDTSLRFRAIRLYRKFTASKLETKNISETGYRLVKEIAFNDFSPDENDKLYVPTTGMGSEPWKWIEDTTSITNVTFMYMDMLFHDKNIFIGTGTLFDIMQDYRKEQKKFYKDAVYLGGRRYIFGADDYKDRVYFSTIVSEVPYPQLDIFAGHNYFSVGDNEVITKILIWRDNILVFTEQNIFYVVTQDTDYKVTDNFIGQGTKYPNTITITPRGIIWANDRGVFIFEGSAPKNISMGRWENTWLSTTKTYCHAAYCKYNNSYWLLVSSTVIMVYNADMDYWTKYKPVAIYGYKSFYLGTIDGVFYLVTYTGNTIKICSFPGSPNTGTDYYKHDESYIIPAYITTQRLYDNNDIQKLFTKIDIKCLFDDDYYRPIVTYKMDGIEITADGVGSTWNSIIDGYITLPIPTGETVKEITVPAPTGIASDIQIKILSVGDNTVNKNFRVKSILVYYEPLEELKNVYKTI